MHKMRSEEIFEAIKAGPNRELVSCFMSATSAFGCAATKSCGEGSEPDPVSCRGLPHVEENEMHADGGPGFHAGMGPDLLLQGNN